jgi:hypothetical protein
MVSRAIFQQISVKTHVEKEDASDDRMVEVKIVNSQCLETRADF